MQVAQDLLIGTHQKCGQNVRLAVKAMQRQSFLDVPPVNELVHFAVRIARDIAQNAVMRRFFVQAVDGHDREKLLHRPTILHALE